MSAKKLEPVNAVKKNRNFETRDIEELSKISKVLYDNKIRFHISIRAYAPGEPVKYRFWCDPMTDSKREAIAKAIKEA